MTYKKILIVAFIFAIFSIASNAIGIHTFNKESELKEKNKDSFNYLIAMLTISIIAIILLAIGIFLGYFK